MEKAKNSELSSRLMPRYSKNNRNDIRNYTKIPHSLFLKHYSKYKNEDNNFKIIENSVNVCYYIWTKFLKEIDKN